MSFYFQEKELKRDPEVSEVFKKTHTRKNDGSFVDLKAKKILDVYEQSLSEKLSQMDSNTVMSEDGTSQTIELSQEEKDKLFLQVLFISLFYYFFNLSDLTFCILTVY